MWIFVIGKWLLHSSKIRFQNCESHRIHTSYWSMISIDKSQSWWARHLKPWHRFLGHYGEICSDFLELIASSEIAQSAKNCSKRKKVVRNKTSCQNGYRATCEKHLGGVHHWLFPWGTWIDFTGFHLLNESRTKARGRRGWRGWGWVLNDRCISDLRSGVLFLPATQVNAYVTYIVSSCHLGSSAELQDHKYLSSKWLMRSFVTSN